MQFNNPILNKRNETKNMTTLHLRESICRSPLRLAFLLIPLALACFALSPGAQAVSPPPDGGYPGFNTAEGDHALENLVTGEWNTAVGAFSLFSVAFAADFNTAVGGGALYLNSANSNTAVGAAALLLNVFGTRNAAVGTAALESNSDGSDNTANGAFALFSNTVGAQNTAVGASALSNNTGGAGNTATGYRALSNSTLGFNTATGANALSNNTTGSLNTAIGSSAGSAVTTASNVIAIGSDVAGADVSNTTWIGNVYGVTTQSGTTAPVIVSDTGQLGTVASSERFKKDIATMDKASEAILSLRPVRFHYKTDTRETPQFGLIAEEVAKVNPALYCPTKKENPTPSATMR